MFKQLIKKWLGLTELEKEYQDHSFLKDFEEYITTRVDELEYDVRYLEKLEKQRKEKNNGPKKNWVCGMDWRKLHE